MSLELQFQTEGINVMISSVVKNLKEWMPKTASLISEKGYFVTTLAFEEEPEKVYSIVDFTSKQIEHLHDIDAYSKKSYQKFMDKPYSC